MALLLPVPTLFVALVTIAVGARSGARRAGGGFLFLLWAAGVLLVGMNVLLDLFAPGFYVPVVAGVLIHVAALARAAPRRAYAMASIPFAILVLSSVAYTWLLHSAI
ncbi:MAG TPA: hypothetical protein VF699_03835 [Caulobacteraceae bacterium]